MIAGGLDWAGAEMGKMIEEGCRYGDRGVVDMRDIRAADIAADLERSKFIIESVNKVNRREAMA